MIKEDVKQRFLDELAATGDWKAASMRIGKSRHTTHGWRRKNKDFSEKADDVLTIWRGGTGEKKCRKCLQIRETEAFEFRSDRQSYRSICNVCRAEGQRKRYDLHRKNAWFLHKATRARTRAKWLGVPFSLDAEHLESIWTVVCPISGVALDKDAPKQSPNYPELDRLIPERGYTTGNVTFLGSRMNKLKSDATLEEMEMIYNWMRGRMGVPS